MAARPHQVILTFHGIGEPGRSCCDDERAFWISTELYRDIISAVQREPNVAVTFDDGNASDVETALPPLVSAGLKATFFVLAGRLDKAGYLAPDDLSSLSAAGMQIGSHGMRHRPWRDLDEHDAHEELVVAREVLESHVGKPVDRAACPFGVYDRTALGRLRRAGYQTVYTSDGGLARAGRWLQPRRSIRAEDTAEAILRYVRYRPGRVARAGQSLRRGLKRLR